MDDNVARCQLALCSVSNRKPAAFRAMCHMLHEFISLHRIALIKRCQQKGAMRYQPTLLPADLDHGVPIFLQQLTVMLLAEQLTFERGGDGPQAVPAPTVIGHAAALHGAELLRLGYT